ncbi:acyl transferase [Robiginitalea sp. SC105]|uniref:LuxE/PaaK family acyltransferase n=1 Tax=Robiginitalea sp. SC105 TaxID=2762332 RepID=UPI00163B1E3B|nr:acyl transferase [Robiginitalea sp. SC105]MBC2837904.1 acyl transferase [Robiginitalea sp. SC105]
MDPFETLRIENNNAFEQRALALFREQCREVPVYAEFCRHLGVLPQGVTRLADIPFLPIACFKDHRVLRSGLTGEIVFQSSGTTDSGLSRHHVPDTALYEASFSHGFEYFYGPVQDWCILALLPSYQERPGSSLIYMVEGLIAQGAAAGSGFLSGEPGTIARRVQEADRGGKQVLLIGVSFALLDLAEACPMQLRNTAVMETGGMKGRRKEIVREELHQRLCKGFGLDRIHSEYGMTELLSQAYSAGHGIFRCPPWMQVLIRDTEDPLSLNPPGKTGGINVVDLANRDSCAFIATQDLGKLLPDNGFEVLGRFDHSDIRGCNLLAISP